MIEHMVYVTGVVCDVCKKARSETERHSVDQLTGDCSGYTSTEIPKGWLVFNNPEANHQQIHVCPECRK